MAASVRPESHLFFHETSVGTSLPLTTSCPFNSKSFGDAKLREKWNKRQENKGIESRAHTLVDAFVTDVDPLLGRRCRVEVRRILSAIQSNETTESCQRSLLAATSYINSEISRFAGSREAFKAMVVKIVPVLN
jgi:hypothetical protein